MLHPPIGVSDFKKLIKNKDPKNKGYLFVDKTSFIKEIIYDLTEAIVITRPRRFGKTLNLSMLHYFFAAVVEDQPTKGLFDGLEISKDLKCMKHQGKYPVVFISFKDIKQPNFELCLEKIKSTIASIYRQFRKELESNKIHADDLAFIKIILHGQSNRIQLETAIKRLLELLFKYYQEKPILLIDEYDTPLQEAYLNNYYDQLIPFFRNFLSEPLKDNSVLNRAILTGILRISKESLFSGVNNVKIYSILNNNYAQYFGFTEEEINILLNKAQLSININHTKKWYNGYNFGDKTIYNPWSIIELIQEQGKLRSYWINTSNNDLIKKLITESSYNIQENIVELISEKSIKTYIDEHFTFNDLKKNPETIWSLLLMSGYLKYMDCEIHGGRYLCTLSIPNNEVLNFYISTIEDWMTGNRNFSWYQEFLNNLTTGMINEFEQKLQLFVEETLSFHDVTKKSQEYFYHALLLGITAGLKQTYSVYSNKESGLGRYDIAIIPKNHNNLGIIIELKAIEDPLKLEKTSLAALEQIKQLKYIAEFKSHEIINICCIGIAFSGKNIKTSFLLDKVANIKSF